ncbi:exported hypothetical protein [Paraburkholderia unamae]|uniref:DUF7024 domain-containing protein n=1 Tax=Paraburkholderia unamae TaxID=219649 RepID=UPI001CB1A810|nr:hypothetical protein [Paraburkholderia unamae]CAG9260993.1 exported hypothetical protein [Paraburkholderia unamae]
MKARRFTAMRALLPGAALALGALYCATAWYALHPAVSREYDLYYLRHQLRTWPGNGGLAYRPGERIDFSRTLPWLSRTGWSNPERWGTWTDGDSASLYLTLPGRPASNMTLRVQGRGFVDARHPVQSVRVVVNGIAVGALAYASQDAKTQTLTIPKRAFSGSNVEIDLIPANPAKPSEGGASQDTRRLGLGVASIELLPG